jgi:hypothetical protein
MHKYPVLFDLSDQSARDDFSPPLIMGTVIFLALFAA